MLELKKLFYNLLKGMQLKTFIEVLEIKVTDKSD
jgi:hypothetical protein